MAIEDENSVCISPQDTSCLDQPIWPLYTSGGDQVTRTIVHAERRDWLQIGCVLMLSTWFSLTSLLRWTTGAVPVPDLCMVQVLGRLGRHSRLGVASFVGFDRQVHHTTASIYLVIVRGLLNVDRHVRRPQQK